MLRDDERGALLLRRRLERERGLVDLVFGDAEQLRDVLLGDIHFPTSDTILPNGLLQAAQRLLKQLALVVAPRELFPERDRQTAFIDTLQDRELGLQQRERRPQPLEQLEPGRGVRAALCATLLAVLIVLVLVLVFLRRGAALITLRVVVIRVLRLLDRRGSSAVDAA